MMRATAARFLLPILLIAAGYLPTFADSTDTKARVVTKLADGVYEIRHVDSPDGNLNGNTTVVIGDKNVLVVDSCFQLSAAAEDIAQIRQWTDRPVRYVVNTHWHNDHNVGNSEYKKAFPNVDIVAQTDTARDMYRTPNTPLRFVQQIATREKRLASGKGADGQALTEKQRAALAQNLAGKKRILEELKSYENAPPTLVFEQELSLNLGNREVQIRHLGAGATAGDTIAYLPKEKILIAGDLLTHPVLYTFDGYPSQWIATLERMAQLDAAAIVPGHGEILRDGSYIFLARDLLRSAVDQVHARLMLLTKDIENPSLEEVAKGVDLTQFRSRFVAGSPDSGDDFDSAAAALIKVAYNEAMHNR